MPGEEYRQLLPYLPPALRREFAALPEGSLSGLEEVRLRPELPLLLRFDGRELFLSRSGGLTEVVADARLLSREELKKTMLLLSDSSVYAFEEELRRGYITLPGGQPTWNT